MHPQHRLRSTAQFERARRKGVPEHALLVLNAVHNDEGNCAADFRLAARRLSRDT
jgi:hypothetical protein